MFPNQSFRCVMASCVNNSPLRYAAKFDPFLSLDCFPTNALHPGAIQGKEGIKFCHLATLQASTSGRETSSRATARSGSPTPGWPTTTACGSAPSRPAPSSSGTRSSQRARRSSFEVSAWLIIGVTVRQNGCPTRLGTIKYQLHTFVREISVGSGEET